MPDRSLALDAAIHILCGHADPIHVRTALGDWRLTRMLALAPPINPGIRAVAALQSGFTALLDARDIADPAVQDAVRALIGMPERKDALAAWAEVAPAGWGADIADNLIAAVRNGSAPRVAAALIGPCDQSADMVRTPQDIAFAVRRWGTSDPNDPPWWIAHVSHTTKERLCADLHRNNWISDQNWASCLPWLPPEMIPNKRVTPESIRLALEAFAIASPVAHARHADVLAHLVNTAHIETIGALTRLACATRNDAIQQRIAALLTESPHASRYVVRAAPWDDLPEDIQAMILNAADTSDICVAVAVARGQREGAPIDQQSAAAFFAALNPDVWDAMNAASQRQWRDALDSSDAHLAVRSLGLRPEILARASLSNTLIIAARRHAHDDVALREALFPVELRDVGGDKAARTMAEMLEPPADPGAFFAIASGCRDPAVVEPARAALRSPADLAAAVALRRSGDDNMRWNETCATLQEVLRGRTWDDLAPILALLDDRDRAALIPDKAALAAALASPDRQDAIRQTLDAVAALPPEVAIPALATLERWHARRTDTHDAAAGLAVSLRAHGDRFLEIIDALTINALRTALLPLPDEPGLADAIRALTRDDPDTGRRLACALQQRAWGAARAALLDAPFDHAHAVLRVMPDDDRMTLLSDAAAAAHALAADGRTDDVATAFWRIARNNPRCALALAALASDDADERERGVAMLVDASQTMRKLAPVLRSDVHDVLRAHPVLAAALADLDDDPASAHPTHARTRTVHR